MNLSIIVAMSKNRVIGKDNKMPWHLSSDLKNFKKALEVYLACLEINKAAPNLLYNIGILYENQHNVVVQ